MSVDLKAAAGQVAAIDEAILRFMPFISTAVSFGAPEAAAFMPLIAGLLRAVDEAAKHVATGNNGAAIGDVIDVVRSHITPGLPNAPILGPAPERSASEQGSG